MPIHELVPTLSDLELERLHANAVRLSQSGSQTQRAQAEALLPLLGATLEQRRAAQAAAQKQARTTKVERKTVAAKATQGPSGAAVARKRETPS